MSNGPNHIPNGMINRKSPPPNDCLLSFLIKNQICTIPNIVVRNNIAMVSPHKGSQILNKNKSINKLDMAIIIRGIIKLNGKYKCFESITPNGIRKLIMIIENTTLLTDSKS